MQPKRVLIVEDEGLIANDIAGQLQKSGYQVAAISSSGEEALRLLPGAAPDLVLMDIRLKGKMDGIDTAERVRSDYHLPVIFLTSHADSETLARAKHAEPFGYLVKPFRPVNLCSAIEMALYKHRSERMLVEREAWLNTVLQSTADPTIVTDVNGHVQFLNAGAGELLGWALADVAGKHWMYAAPLLEARSGSAPDDLVRLAAMQMTTLKLPRGMVLRRRDGGETAVEGEVSPSVLRGEIAGAVITIRDVSQRNREEAEVRHEQKMLAVGRMAGGIAHDFNNLLTVILGHGSLLADEESSPGRRKSVNAILDAVQTAGEITRQLLTLCQKQVAHTEILPVNECVRRVAGMVAGSLAAGIQLHTDLDDRAGKVRMASANFDRVLLNLIWNARDAMPSGGTLAVATSHVERVVKKRCGEITESFVRLTVTDSGHGIPADVQEQIFEPFFTTKAHGKGAGLGLAIVYGLVKEVGGEISVRSTPGAGSCFEVIIPRADEEMRQPIGGKKEQAGAGSVQSTVLLVEDQPAIRGLIHNYLEQRGFNLIEAEDAEEAIKLAGMYEGRIDVLISDVLMPKMDGVTLTRQLAVTRPEMKVLLISGQPGEGIEALKDPNFAAAFLPKPFALRVLFEKVVELAGQEAALPI